MWFALLVEDRVAPETDLTLCDALNLVERYRPLPHEIWCVFCNGFAVLVRVILQTLLKLVGVLSLFHKSQFLLVQQQVLSGAISLHLTGHFLSLYLMELFARIPGIAGAGRISE